MKEKNTKIGELIIFIFIIYLIIEIFISVSNTQFCEGLGTKKIPQECSYIFKFWKPDEIIIYNEEGVERVYNKNTKKLIKENH